MLFVAGVNRAIGSNYLFIAHKPDVATALDLLGPWPWYIAGMQIVGIILAVVLYLPFAIKDWREKRAGTGNAALAG
jgi:uncharacterized membrane protein YwaF